MKRVYIEAHFPDLKGNCYGTGRGEGSTVQAAIGSAVRDLLKTPKLRRKHLHSIKMTLSITSLLPVEDTSLDRKADAEEREHKSES